MMESLKKMSILLITIGLMIQLSLADTRYYAKMPVNTTNPLKKIIGLDGSRMINHQDENQGSGVKIVNNRRVFPVLKTRSRFHVDDETMIRESLKANLERRNSFVESSTFDPDVLNKFLDDYANKIKSTTERNNNFPFRATKPNSQQLNDDNRVGISSVDSENENETNKTTENPINTTVESVMVLNPQDLNDTIKRNKFYGSNSNDDRNGWVTLEAIPWSKSKISKWQASSSSQRPWPEMKVWEKPNNGKPWTSEFPSRPAYINNEPWHESPKPQRPDYQSDRPSLRPQSSTRPSYFDDRFDDNSNQAQKWPPERPQSSWEKFPSSDSYRPTSDIITDDRPSNFPSNWDKYSHASNNNNKPTYSYNDRDRYTSNDNYDKNYNNGHHYQHQNENHDWPSDNRDNYPSKFEHYKNKPTNFGRPNNDQTDHHENHHNRPQHHLSHYQYTSDHPPSHPSSGEGQWVLLSTNRGYSKSRQRSLKLDPTEDKEGKMSQTNGSLPARTTKQENDGTVAVMTSKRQVRLTVLPSINGTNTTTSHGGLLEVERTFKTVDQSQKEFEEEEEANKLTSSIRPQILKKRPIRNTIVRRPSNSAVLAAVGAGMLPATMAMMIPMMLGRKKRSPDIETISRELFDTGKSNEEFSNHREIFGTRRKILRREDRR